MKLRKMRLNFTFMIFQICLCVNSCMRYFKKALSVKLETTQQNWEWEFLKIKMRLIINKNDSCVK